MPPGMLLFHLEVNFAVNQHVQEADEEGYLCGQRQRWRTPPDKVPESVLSPIPRAFKGNAQEVGSGQLLDCIFAAANPTLESSLVRFWTTHHCDVNACEFSVVCGSPWSILSSLPTAT
jgi:hypothetical protein